MSVVAIGLIGCGSFGESHLQAFRAIPTAQVTAVYDLDFDRASSLAKRFGIERICRSLPEICEIAGLDAIDVVTDEAAHEQGVLASFRAGKHVFVEKPFATDLAACSRMIEASKQVDKYLMVGHVLRFETRYAMLKEAIDSGRFGKVVSIHARRNRPRRILEGYSRVHPVLLSCIHDIDYLLWCVGKRVVKVRGFGRRATQPNQYDTFWGVIEFEGGVIAVVETHSILPNEVGVGQDDAFQVIGDKGTGKLQLFPGGLSFWTDRGFELPDVGYDPRVMNSARGALRDELAYFVECIRTKNAPTINSGIDGRRAVQVAKALIESGDCERDIAIENWE
jgi:UDP-N-acetylglucosamine 3-dehydrogenase